MSRIRSILHRAGARIGRPSSPLGSVKYAGVAIGLAILLVAALAVGAVAAATFYDQYGAHQERNAQAWAALTPAVQSIQKSAMALLERMLAP